MTNDALKIDEHKKLSPIEYRRLLFEAKVIKFYKKWKLDDYKDKPAIEQYLEKLTYNKYKFFFREVKTLFPHGPGGDDRSLAAEIYRLSTQQPPEYIKIKKEKILTIGTNISPKKKGTRTRSFMSLTKRNKRKNRHIRNSKFEIRKNSISIFNPITETEEATTEAERIAILNLWIQKNKSFFEDTPKEVFTLENLKVNRKQLEEKHQIWKFETEFIAYHHESDDWIKYKNFERLLRPKDRIRLEELTTLERLKNLERLEELEELEKLRNEKKEKLDEKRNSINLKMKYIKTYEALQKLKGFKEVENFIEDFQNSESFQDFESVLDFEELEKFTGREKFKRIKAFLHKIKGKVEGFEELRNIEKLEEISYFREYKKRKKDIIEESKEHKTRENEFQKNANPKLRKELKRLRNDDELYEMRNLMKDAGKDLQMQYTFGDEIWRKYGIFFKRLKKILPNKNIERNSFIKRIYALYKGKYLKLKREQANPEQDIEKAKALKKECWDEIVTYTEICDLEHELLETIIAYIESPKTAKRQPNLEIFIRKNLEALKTTTEDSSPIHKAISELLNNGKNKIKVDTILQLPEVTEALTKKAIMEEYNQAWECDLENELLEKIIADNNAAKSEKYNLIRFIRKNKGILKVKPKSNRPVLRAVSIILKNKNIRNQYIINTILQLPEIAEALAEKAKMEEAKRKQEEQVSVMDPFDKPQNEKVSGRKLTRKLNSGGKAEESSSKRKDSALTLS